ncbi:MAG: cryptochrome/photolyase family protein [Planctomycetes bacterium]|nr:cryptochrome/photolyase family protein [Planctomycetota bacterium]
MTGIDLFRRELARVNPRAPGRRWIFVPYDQLSDRIGPLGRLTPSEAAIVLVESPWKASLRPYHRQKLGLVLANLRHFALEQARRGVHVEHVVSTGTYADALERVARQRGPLALAEPAERELRIDLAPLVASGLVRCEAHDGWLTAAGQFERACGAEPPFRMDAFYRLVRRESGVLMERDRPLGGRFSFDGENRRRWDGQPAAPEPPRFEPDAITREVGELVERRFARHPGRLDLTTLPATASDAERMLAWARTECLEHFGPFEDALSTRSRGLFHTRLAPLVNLHRVLPRDLLDMALTSEAPLASREGFVRQVLGWREFVRHVHRATDGFRSNLGRAVLRADRPGDGGWSRWSGNPWHTARPHDGSPVHPGARSAVRATSRAGTRSERASAEVPAIDAALPNAFGARRSLPAAYWGQPSGLNCLDTVVRDVWEEGWSHHITRLMVLANIATLLDVEPRELTDWFWCAYVDAYDWVVEPNVLGMGTFAAGDVLTTKPYVAGAAYVDRMGDYCAGCRFEPGQDCPLTPLYWAFLARHARQLAGLPRLRLPLRALARRPLDRRRQDARVFEEWSRRLADGSAAPRDPSAEPAH